MPSRAARDLQVVGEDDIVEPDDAETEAQLMAAFASTRAREKTEVAAVEIQRYRDIPQRDPGGKLQRDAAGKPVLGSLVLYFRRLDPGTLLNLRQEFNIRTPIRRGGRTVYEEKFDDEGLALRVAWLGMMPWCRQLYFENQKLWADEPVGTGEEFMRQRLNMGELSYCLDAVQQLEGLGEEQSEQMGKFSNRAAPSTSGQR